MQGFPAASLVGNRSHKQRRSDDLAWHWLIGPAAQTQVAFSIAQLCACNGIPKVSMVIKQAIFKENGGMVVSRGSEFVTCAKCGT
jgi:hypothetical protein